MAASCNKFTSLSIKLFLRIASVWILKIYKRPFSSGRPISKWISKRPGLSNASSIISSLLVIPIIKILLRLSTPSIFERSWLTTDSFTPVPEFVLPRLRQIASISSKIMTCRSDSSPLFYWSDSASANSLRTFSSEPPTNLSKISGPLTTLGS